MPGQLQHLTSHLPLRPDSFFGRGSVEVTSPKPSSGEGPVRRLAVTSGELIERPATNVATVPDVLAYAVNKYGSQHHAIGYRDVIKVHEEVKEISKFIDGQEVTESRTWKLLEMTEYKYINYSQFADSVAEVRNGLLALDIQTEDVVNIYAQTGYVFGFVISFRFMVLTFDC
jgi:long-chain acyl-CoA synthetase